MTGILCRFDVKALESGSSDRLTLEEITEILRVLPIEFHTIDEEKEPNSFNSYGSKTFLMDVYQHYPYLLELYPPKRKRLAYAEVKSRDFPFRPDKIMDDFGVARCCFHPLLSAFGIRRVASKDPGTNSDIEIDPAIEIDVHKHSYERTWKKLGRIK